jgi:AbrB family looped-hinge helix DNA binding protein
MTFQITIDRFGRIVLPKEVRRRLGIEPGSVLQIEEQGSEIRLKPITGEQGLIMKKGVLVFTGKAAGDIEGAVRAHRDERIRSRSPRR